MNRPQSGPWGLLLAFGAASFAAVSLGVYVSLQAGVPLSIASRNLVAWAIGAVLAAGLSATFRGSMLTVALWLAPLGLVATFLNPGQDGVHRWADLGPVHMNMAMLLLPAAIVSAAARPGAIATWVALAVSMAVLLAQPDASQATALAAAAAAIALLTLRRAWPIAAIILVAGLCAAVAWTRPDPLLPVPEVEGILGLALARSPALGVLTTLAIVVVAVSPVVSPHRAAPPAPAAACALSVCFLTWLATTAIGAFPVPFAGMGMSPIIGGWLAVGLLAGVLRSNADASPQTAAAG